MNCIRFLILGLTFISALAAEIKTVYIVPSSHYDRGFVVPPKQIVDMAAKHLEEVEDTAAKDSSFKWTIESVWQVLAFLQHERPLGDILPGDQQRIDLLMQLIRSRRIELSAVWGSMHTEFMGSEELNRLVYDMARLRRMYGIDSDIALMDDVPGQPYSLPSVLAGSGVKYLLVGANQFIDGGTSLSPGKVPFHWEGRDGTRVLTWVSQSPRGGYTEGLTDFFIDPFTRDPYSTQSFWHIFHPTSPPRSDLEIMQAGMNALLKKYSDAGYPYDAVLVMHMHDFLHPSSELNLERAVALWNGQHRSPVLRIATASEFFQYMEEKYGPRLPVVRGEWSGLWSEAKTSSPLISSMVRRAHDDAPAQETLWSGLAMDGRAESPAGELRHLYELMFKYDEHSGAGNTGWPELNTWSGLQQQNEQYVSFANELKDNLTSLVHCGLSLLQESAAAPVKAWPLVVWNSLSFERSGPVVIGAPEKNAHIIKIRDARTGRNVPFDIDEDGRAVFVAEHVPSMGYASYEVDVGAGEAKASLEEPMRAGSIQNRFFRVTARNDGSIQSIVDLRTGKDLVNANSDLPFNYLLRIEGDEPSAIPMPFHPEITTEGGRVFAQLAIKRMGSGFPLTRLRLYNDLPRVEVENVLDSSHLPFASIRSNFDSYYFSFPFALDPATLQVRPEDQQGFLSLPADYLPGARRDGVTSQHVIAMTDNRSTVLLAHRQAFYFVFPGYVRTKPTAGAHPLAAMFTGKWPLHEATLYSRAVHRASQGDMRLAGIWNFPTVEPGLGDRYVFDYAVGSGGAPFDAVRATHFGRDFDDPLQAEYMSSMPAPLKSLFSVDQPNIEIVTVKQAEGTPSAKIDPVNPAHEASNQFVIRLQEIAGIATPRVRVTLPVQIRSAEIVNLTEEHVLQRLSPSPLIVSLQPHQTLSIRVEIANGKSQ